LRVARALGFEKVSVLEAVELQSTMALGVFSIMYPNPLGTPVICSS
jgi:hypothetical protein